MEVEVKLQIPDFINFSRLKQLISPSHVETRHQRDFFFDSSDSALSSRRAVLRLRKISRISAIAGVGSYFLTLKGNAMLVNGVSRVEEDEEEIDPADGEACISDVSVIESIRSRVIKRCQEEFGVKGGSRFVCLGGFESVRDVYNWRDGLKLEVDEVKFAFGTRYEVECETADPESVKGNLEDFFRDNGIEFRDSEMSKFAIFKSGKMPT